MNLTGKTYFFFLATILVLTTMLSVTTAESKSIKEEVIIIYENDIGKAAIKEITNDISHQFTSIPALVVSLTEKDIIAIAQNPHIKSVEKNSGFTIIDQGFIANPETQIYLNMDVIDITDDHYQWNINEVNPKSTWDDGYTGKDVKVAVIDTGISPHPNLLIAGGISTVSYTGSWEDDNGHGTHVAGTIAAKDNNGKGIVGMAPDVKIYAVKALDQNGQGTLLTVLNAIEWSIINDIDIINFSLGTEDNISALKDMIDVAYDHGITMVAASGNSGNSDGTGNNVTFPAKYDHVIAISAVEENLTRASFSSTGEEIEFSAPGINIISTYLNNQYANASGTSFATPHISGMLAILKQMHPEMMNVELRNELKNYAIDLGQSGRDSWYGHGFVKYEEDTPAAQVSRIGGVNLYETSALISQEGWDTSEFVILARGDRFSDALTGVPLATKYDAPLLLSRSNRLDDSTKNELLRLETKTVIILGGHLAIEKRVVDEIELLGIEVERIAGANMHVTAELIAKEVAPNGSETAIIVSDNRFQDALSVASYAGVRGIPILLANTENLPSATQRALDELGITETLVIGGELAISSNVEMQLPSPERIAGQTMFDTNIEVFNYFQPNTNKAYVATSKRFQDGLSGAALAARVNVGVLLVGDTIHATTKDNIVSANYSEIRVLGGELAVTANVQDELTNLLQ